MNKHKQSSGDSSRERCTYLAGISDGQRVKAQRKVIRTGHLGDQVYKNVTMVLNGVVIYSQDL